MLNSYFADPKVILILFLYSNLKYRSNWDQGGRGRILECGSYDSHNPSTMDSGDIDCGMDEDLCRKETGSSLLLLRWQKLMGLESHLLSLNKCTRA